MVGILFTCGRHLHGRIISLKGEVRAGIYSIVFGYIYFSEVKWLEH